VQVCDNKYTFLVTTHCPRAQTPVALRSSSGLRRRTRHKHPRTCRTPAARDGEEEGQEDQVDGANEHQAGSTAHRRMHLDRLRLYEPCSSPGGAYKHLPCLRHVLLLVVSGSCAKRDNDDKTVELMVLMSTSHVALHISGHILSGIIYLIQVLGQKAACCAQQGAESRRQASPIVGCCRGTRCWCRPPLPPLPLVLRTDNNGRARRE